MKKTASKKQLLQKSPAGINGFDETTHGDLPQGRTTLLLINPQLSREHQILAISPLVRKLPVPVRKIIGDLSTNEKVLVGLDVKPGE